MSAEPAIARMTYEEYCALERGTLLNPLLVVEVLSDSTEAYDRGEKASHYRRCPSVQADLLVAQSHSRLELQS